MCGLWEIEEEQDVEVVRWSTLVDVRLLGMMNHTVRGMPELHGGECLQRRVAH